MVSVNLGTAKNWANPITHISTKPFNYSEHCFQQLVLVYFQLYMCKKRLLASKRLHKKEHSITSYIKHWGGGGGGGGGGIGPKRPTLKSGRNNPGRNDSAETTHGRNDSRPKRPETGILGLICLLC